MKHLTVLHSFPVWLEQTQTWIYGQVSELQRQGLEAHVVCERTKNLDQFGVENIHCLANASVLRRVWDKGLRKLGIRRHIGYLAYVGRAIKADIVHSHFGDVGWVDLGALRSLRAKHVVTFYGYDVNMLPGQYPVWRERYQTLFEEVDMVLCEGSHMARCIVELGCPEEKVKVQHLGVDVERIVFQPRQWKRDEPLRVLIAASFREKKGISYAIEALGRLNKTTPINLTIIGDAYSDPVSQQEKQRIMTAIEQGGLSDKVRLLGYQPHEVLLREAYQHHLFLHPSVTASNGDTEGGAPVTIIEMLASGMPVVSTRHCDIPEVMGESLHHLLADERDVDGLYEIMKKLTDKPEAWIEIAGQGRARILLEYDRVKQGQRLAAFYADLGGE
jgi:colanic acid/amylovoran biosynthesis glycosyltransferase